MGDDPGSKDVGGKIARLLGRRGLGASRAAPQIKATQHAGYDPLDGAADLRTARQIKAAKNRPLSIGIGLTESLDESRQGRAQRPKLDRELKNTCAPFGVALARTPVEHSRVHTSQEALQLALHPPR